MAIVFEEASTIASVVHWDIYANYPSTVNANDILICKIGQNITGQSWSTGVSGWVEIYDASWGCVYYKRATGSESGTAKFTSTKSNVQSAVIYRFSGCITTGTPYEQNANRAALDNNVDIPDLAGDTTGPNRLVIATVQITDDLYSNTGATNYTSQDEQVSSVNLGSANHLWTVAQAAAGRPGADSYGIELTGYDDMTINVMALIPVPAAGGGYANDVNTVGTAAIGKINGVATADIGKVNTA